MSKPVESVELVTRTAGVLERAEQTDYDSVWNSFINSLSPHTRRAYTNGMRVFSAWLGFPIPKPPKGDKSVPVVPIRALAALLKDHGTANRLITDFANDLRKDGKSASTINLRTAPIRKVVWAAKFFGLISWEIEALHEKIEGSDMEGPGGENVKKIYKHFSGKTDQQSLRNSAMVHLLAETVLRRSEVSDLDLENVDDTKTPVRIRVKRKGYKKRKDIGLPDQTWKALQTWIEVRKTLDVQPEEGARNAVFVSLDPVKFGHRLTGSGVYYIIQTIAEELGIKKLRPHGFRHTGITIGLDKNNGNLRASRQHSGHASFDTIQRYDDAREDLGLATAQLVANELDELGKK